MTTVMESVESGARLRVGVVGSGLSGLHVAWALSCAEHFPAGHPLATRPPEVHLFERASAIGFDAASVDVLGGRARVDVPMRGFYVSYYPRLATLYRATGVQFRRRCENPDARGCKGPGAGANSGGRRGGGRGRQGPHDRLLPLARVQSVRDSVARLSVQHAHAARCVTRE